MTQCKPFMLSLSKHCLFFRRQEGQPFDRLRANGIVRVTLALLLATSAPAANTLVHPAKPIKVAGSPLAVTPPQEWNRLGRAPGRHAEAWTLDGAPLNQLIFYGGIETGSPLYREHKRRQRPLPHFSSTMLLTDIPPLLESSYRVSLGTTLITLGRAEPVTFAGRRGIRFAYDFTVQSDEVHRQGEGWATIADGHLYMITFEAPAIHYFAAGIAAARAVAESATLP